MAFYNKVGLLILSEDKSKFLVCQKYAHNFTVEYIMPGGKKDENDDLECLKNEIKQELNCEIDFDSLQMIGIYEDMAAGRSDRDVQIKLYSGKIIGHPIASTEIEKVHWINKNFVDDIRVSSIVRNKIIPDIVARNILL